jgi:CRISPR/Cas system-associated exonuclease Cas4 (RecB family)
MNKLKHISASQLSTFDQCPRKWYYNKILKVEEDTVPNTTHADLGSALHRVMELSLLAVQKGNKKFSNPLRLIPLAIKEHNVIPEFQKLLPTLVENIVNCGWFKNPEESVLEGEMNFKIDGTKVIIKIDRLVQTPKLTKIIDLKTNKRPFSDGIEKLWQSRLYAYPFLKDKPITVEYWFARFKNKKAKALIFPSSKKKIERAVMASVKAMKEEDGSNYKTSGLCERFCPYYQKCLENRKDK